jgi:AraC family transcriptional regulator, transcriptional activator of pobA
MNRAVPTYELYGEQPARGTDDFPEYLLHCEEIEERSRHHGWEIQPHRHRHYFQILYIHQGEAEIVTPAGRRVASLPCLILVPTGTVHGFLFSRNVEGYVLTLASARLAELTGRALPRCTRLPQTCCLELALPPVAPTGTPRAEMQEEDDTAARLRGMMAQIGQELRHRRMAFGPVVEGLLLAALALADRLLPDGDGDDFGQSTGDRRLALFDRLVETHFRSHRSVAFYAEALAMSATHLNRILDRHRGQTVQAHLAARLIDEAKRALLFTDVPVKVVAFNLGFADTAYFTRYFKRAVGLSPSLYRQARQDRFAAAIDSIQ